MVHVLYFAYLPNDLILDDPRVSLSAANGQFMCFRRTAYDRIDGHRSVRASLVEDVFLAREIKRSGGRIALVDGTDAVSCRMYTSAAEVTKGFSKNFFPATDRNLPLTLLFLAHLVTAYVVPLPMVVVGLALDRPIVWGAALAHLALAGGIRALISHRFAMPWWHALLQPITGAWAAFIGINSIRWAYSRHGAQWKGRSYTTPRDPHA
jgi:chlorobactene glucosyltransferase